MYFTCAPYFTAQGRAGLEDQLGLRRMEMGEITEDTGEGRRPEEEENQGKANRLAPDLLLPLLIPLVAAALQPS